MILLKKLTSTERLNTIKVTSSNAISKFGDVLFDYINSVFLSNSRNGGLWLALYQSSEVLISVFFNFWGGALSDKSCSLNTGITGDVYITHACLIKFKSM